MRLPLGDGRPPDGWTPDAPPCLANVSTVALDTETTGLRWFARDQPVGIGVAWGDPARPCARYLPFAHRGGGNLDPNAVREWARRELRNKHILGLHTKFDAHMLRVWGVDLVAQGCTFEDVGHSAALLDDHRTSFGLDTLALEVLGEGKLDIGDPLQIHERPAWEIAPYGRRDPSLVLRLHHAYAAQLAGQDLGPCQALENRVLPVVIEMEKNGMPIDVERLALWEAESSELLDRLHWDAWLALGFSVNPDSPLDMTRVFKTLGIPITKRTVLGKPSFTKDVLRAQSHPTIHLLTQIGKLTDLRTKYLTKYLGEHVNGVLYPTLRQTKIDEGGTVSGRFSCANPNLQQVLAKDKHHREYAFLKALSAHGWSYEIKELFHPAEGWSLGSADARQIEYRIFAHYAASEKLLARYREDPNVDFHDIVKLLIVAARPDVSRTEVKVANFLKIFGGGVGALALNLAISDADARSIDDAYNAQFPEARALVRKAKGIAETRGYVKTFLGRRSRFPNGERSHKALNTIVQGTASEINKVCMCEVYDRREALGVLLRMTVHDELVFDIADPNRIGTVREVLNTQYVPLTVPILWQVGCGATWAEAK